MKPVKPAELRSAIEVAIYKHELENRHRGHARWAASTLRSIGDAVVSVDLAGNVQFMNPAAETLTGVTAERAIGRPVHDLMQRIAPGQRLAAAATVVADPPGGGGPPAPAAHAATGPRILSDRASPITDDGHQLGAVMVFRDITEQMLHHKQLELADHLSSLGTLAAGVAHEVGNPLEVVLGNAAYVLEELRHQQRAGTGDIRGLGEAIQAQTEIEAAARQIAAIVADLQTFSRPAPPARDGGDLDAAVAWAVRSTAHELGNRARVVTKVARTPRVAVDTARLEHIVVNLLINAAHAIAPGRAEANTVTVEASAHGDQVVIEVSDTGGGMPPEVLDHMFEPFYATKAGGTGAGLELAACHGIVTSVGGRVEAESTVGAGSRFRVTLPVAVTPPAVAPAPAAAHRRGRVLVVDDDRMVLRTMKRMLVEHDVMCIDDAREALAMTEQGQRFDVIFSDVMMPRMTGIELYERLLASHPEVARRVVFVTGAVIDDRIADFLAVVRNDCLKKPFLVETLRAAVQQRLAGPAG